MFYLVCFSTIFKLPLLERVNLTFIRLCTSDLEKEHGKSPNAIEHRKLDQQHIVHGPVVGALLRICIKESADIMRETLQASVV